MTGPYQIVDERTWKRAQHCRVFRDSVEPCYCVTLELDITHFLERVKAQKHPFTFSMIYLVTRCANSVEAFRYRFLDGKVVLFERIHTAFTWMDDGDDLFKVVNVPFLEPIEDYIALASKTALEQKEYFTGPLGNDIFQFSPLPWVSYTHISHTISGKKDNATPLFDWGKYFQRDGKTVLPFSIQVHHSFVDGVHIGQLANAIQVALDDF